MQVLQKLTLANLRQNKRRTMVTIIGVMLSAALILAVIGIVTSFRQMMIDFQKIEVGDFHEMYESVPAEQMKYITENAHVESFFYSKPITANNLPDNMDEETFKTYEVYQHSPYSSKYYEKLTDLPADNTAPYNIYVRYDKPGEYLTYRKQILETISGDENVNYRTNSELLRYEAGVMGDTALSAIISLACIVIVIIIVTSIFAIRNSFSISATERARQFGMLSSIGATSKQIRQSVIFEGLVIASIGIPLGIALGAVAVIILVAIMNLLMDGIMVAKVPVAMPFWIFLFAIALSLITTFLSSLFPAIRASRLSPIVAIRGNQDIKVKAKKLRTPKFIYHIFGIGGVIANKNLKRSRKKYRTTVISIVISVATFIGLFSFLDYGQRITGLQYKNSNIDLAISGAPTELYRSLVQKFNLHDSTYYVHAASRSINVLFVEQSYFEKYAQSLGIHESSYDKVAIMIDKGMTMLDDGSYKLESVYPDLKEGDNLAVEFIKEVHYEQMKLDDGTEFITQSYNEDDVFSTDIKITKITDEFPMGLENQYSIYIFIPENYYLKDIIPDPSNITNFFAAEVEGVSAVIDYLDGLKDAGSYDKMYYQDVKEVTAQSRRMFLLISIFLYGFIIVVTLIGVTNIFNTITTNVALRAKEFAMLKSIGMTSREFNHMIRLESLMYVGKALLIGIPLGLLLSYAFYTSFADAVDFGYVFPWPALLISVVAVGLLIGIIMRYSVKQIEKQNIIETIRAENI